MVYVATLSLMAKKALGNKCHQASINNIIDTLAIDANVSNMDVLVLGPADFNGAAAKKLGPAVAARHPSICVIYICTNDKEAKLFPDAPNVKRCKKITGDVIKEAISEFYGKDPSVVNAKYDSMSAHAQNLGTNPIPAPGRVVRNRPAPAPEPESEPAPEPEPEPEPAPVELELPPIEEAPAPAPAQRELPPSPIDIVSSVHNIRDWDLFKQQLKRDTVMADALLRSSEMAGIRQMMDVWDVKMTEAMADSHLTNEQKLAAIREFGSNRSALQASQNSKLVDDFIKIMQTVTAVASRIVEDRLNEIDHAVASTQMKRGDFLEQVIAGEDKPADQLTGYAVELVNIKAAITDLYAFAYKESSEQIIQRMDEKLPSGNAYINAMLGKSAELFRPANSESLVNLMFKGLKESRMTLTQVQDKVNALIDVLFNIAKTQADMMDYHRDVISCLRANHVENIVIRNTLLKDCFRVFVGNKGTGLTATVTMFAGMQARRGNTLVIDLTGHASYENYGHKPITMAEFMAERVQRPLLFVATDETHDPEKLAMLMEECKARMSYYNNLVFVLDTEQTEELDQVGREALTIAYVTNCTATSLKTISECYQKAREIPNVGTLLCAIDAPVDATVVINTLQMDISKTRLVLIPYLRDIRKAAIVHEDPATYGDTLRVFEEAFRV